MSGAAPEIGTSPSAIIIGGLTGVLSALQGGDVTQQRPVPVAPSVAPQAMIFGLPLGVAALLGLGAVLLLRK